MTAFRKFDPQAYRQTRVAPASPAKPAKVAKPALTPPHFSGFSRFSRGTSPGCDSWTAADWQAYFEERAAIREHDGGFAKSEAERLAFDDTLTYWLAAHPPPASALERCVHCRGVHRPYDELVPVLALGGHVWVHNVCWTEWYAARRQEGTTALKANGVALPPAEESSRDRAEKADPR